MAWSIYSIASYQCAQRDNFGIRSDLSAGVEGTLCRCKVTLNYT